MASGSSPGEVIVPLYGPELPAETTTVIPACHALSTAWSSGSVTLDEVGMAPSDMLRTRMLYRAWFAMAQLTPWITVARSV